MVATGTEKTVTKTILRDKELRCTKSCPGTPETVYDPQTLHGVRPRDPGSEQDTRRVGHPHAPSSCLDREPGTPGRRYGHHNIVGSTVALVCATSFHSRHRDTSESSPGVGTRDSEINTGLVGGPPKSRRYRCSCTALVLPVRDSPPSIPETTVLYRRF